MANGLPIIKELELLLLNKIKTLAKIVRIMKSWQSTFTFKFHFGQVITLEHDSGCVMKI